MTYIMSPRGVEIALTPGGVLVRDRYTEVLIPTAQWDAACIFRVAELMQSPHALSKAIAAARRNAGGIGSDAYLHLIRAKTALQWVTAISEALGSKKPHKARRVKIGGTE